MSKDTWGPYVKKRPKKFDPIRKDEAGDEFIRHWCDAYEEYQWDTPHINKATLHTVLGQVPAVRDMKIYTSKMRNEDGRVHVVWFQQSGTGKAGATYFLKEVTSRINYDNEEKKKRMLLESPDDFTGAAMLGSWEEVEKYVKGQGKMIERYLKPGWLAEGVLDIFLMSEASILFEAKSQFKEELMVWFQMAMDPIGNNKITRKLAKSDPIYVNPKCSFFLASYIPPSFTKRTTERGLVQRTVPIVNDIPIKSRINNILKGIEGMDVEDNEIERMQNELDYLAYYISELQEPYKNMSKFNFKKHAISSFKAITYHIQDMLDGLPRYQQDQLAKFADRSVLQAKKIAMHHAILRRDNKVEVEDVSYAEEYLFPIYAKLFHYFEDALEVDTKMADKDKQMMALIRTAIDDLHKNNLGKNGWVFEQMLVDRISSLKRKRKDYVRRKIKTWIDNGLMEHGELQGHSIVRMKKAQP